MSVKLKVNLHAKSGGELREEVARWFAVMAYPDADDDDIIEATVALMTEPKPPRSFQERVLVLGLARELHRDLERPSPEREFAKGEREF